MATSMDQYWVHQVYQDLAKEKGSVRRLDSSSMVGRLGYCSVGQKVHRSALPTNLASTKAFLPGKHHHSRHT